MSGSVNESRGTSGAIRITSAGHALFAASMIWLGALGLAKGAFVQVWLPVPKWVPVREPLAYLCAVVSLATGVGMLWRRTAALAARVIFVSLVVWLLVMRLPNLFYESPLVLVAWSFGCTGVMAAAAWVLTARFAAESGTAQAMGPRATLFADARGVRVAKALFGLSLIPFGLAHFMYLDATTVLIPNWLPWHVALAYLTGGAFIAAGLAVALDVSSRLAGALVTLQIGLFSVIVWIPRVWTGNLTEFQRGEVVATWVLMAGAWVMAES